ncbi:MAG: hypothetical protein JWM52_658 [Candidatus Saccharibacteria bacterium]|nr:hypothetical protein [Candidatus Saccharibacteria bacterium]
MFDLALDESLDDVRECEHHHEPDQEDQNDLDGRQPDDSVADIIAADEVCERDVNVEILHLHAKPECDQSEQPSENRNHQMQRVRQASPDRQADQQEASKQRQLHCPHNPRRVHSSSLGVVVVVYAYYSINTLNIQYQVDK